MKIPFWHYLATGNSFLFFENRGGALHEYKRKLFFQDLARKYEVDGFVFLEESRNPQAHFHMRYLNADGGEVEMCGNGARSIIHFASKILNIPWDERGYYSFTTQGALYRGSPLEEGLPVQMTELRDLGKLEIGDLLPEALFSYYLNTGVPHAIFQVPSLDAISIHEIGARIRYDKRFEKGVNVNFFELREGGDIFLRTYERGVEGETLSCGTGATAVAIALAKIKGWTSPLTIKVLGGELSLSFNSDFSEVFLSGEVILKTKGEADFPSEGWS